MNSLWEKVVFADEDWPEEPPVVLVPAELLEAGEEAFAAHRQALADLVEARRRLRDLQRRDAGLLKTLRREGRSFPSEFEHPDAERLRAERRELGPKIEAALAAVEEAKAERDRAASNLRRSFVPIQVGRFRIPRGEDG